MIPPGWLPIDTPASMPESIPVPEIRLHSGTLYGKRVLRAFAHIPWVVSAGGIRIMILDVNYYARYDLVDFFLPMKSYLKVLIRMEG